MKISIVIPAYNEADNLPGILEELKRNITSNECDVEELEIIVVDDHSNDCTFDVLTQIRDPNIKVIRLSRRSGSHAAL